MAGKSQKSSSSSSSSASTSPAPAAEGYEQPYGNAAVQDECQAHGSEETPDNEVGTARAGAPTSFSEAIARHEENRGIVDRLIRSALEIEVDPIAGADSRANLLRNTAQWIDEGEADLYVLTPVHDAEKRPGCPGDHNAYFDKSKMYDQVGSTYDPTLNAAGEAVNDAGLEFKRPRVAGSMAQDGRRMTLVDPGKRTESQLVGFFVHEVQHDCDQHRGGESWEVERPDRDPNAIRRAPQWTYNSFQSEFRAYWMMNPEGSSVDTKGSSTDGGVTNFSVTAVAPGTDGLVRTADDVSNTVTTAFSNKRQEDIFRHMYGHGKADNVYYDPAAGKGWTKSYAYLPHYYALDPAFKSMVDGYTLPVSGNLINSPRIQDLSDAMGSPAAFETAMKALDDLDIAYLANTSQSQPFWDQAAEDLSIPEILMLSAHLGIHAPMGPYQETVKVVKGDTLGALADRYLGDEGRWQELYQLNRDVIGSNPDLILPGQELRLPSL